MAIGKDKSKRLQKLLEVAFMALILVLGTTACQQGEEAMEEEAQIVEEGKITFEGTVKVALGNYIFVPELQGFDIVVAADQLSGDVADLIGEEVKGEGDFLPERPSVLVADVIELKDESGMYQTIYTRAGDVMLADYVDLATRKTFAALENPAYNKAEDWEGKEQLKVYGALQQQDDATRIQLFTEEGDPAGQVLVDSISDFAQYYVSKLRLFNRFWFYLNVKETVDWGTRRRSRNLFHADVLSVGLF